MRPPPAGDGSAGRLGRSLCEAGEEGEKCREVGNPPGALRRGALSDENRGQARALGARRRRSHRCRRHRRRRPVRARASPSRRGRCGGPASRPRARPSRRRTRGAGRGPPLPGARARGRRRWKPRPRGSRGFAGPRESPVILPRASTRGSLGRAPGRLPRRPAGVPLPPAGPGPGAACRSRAGRARRRATPADSSTSARTAPNASASARRNAAPSKATPAARQTRSPSTWMSVPPASKRTARILFIPRARRGPRPRARRRGRGPRRDRGLRRGSAAEARCPSSEGRPVPASAGRLRRAPRPR